MLWGSTGFMLWGSTRNNGTMTHIKVSGIIAYVRVDVCDYEGRDVVEQIFLSASDSKKRSFVLHSYYNLHSTILLLALFSAFGVVQRRDPTTNFFMASEGGNGKFRTLD